MSVYVALLRAVNLGPHQQVAMAELRGLFARLGFDDARSVVNSGNLVFRADSRASARSLERRLETETKKRLGLETDFFLRTAAEWARIVADNPFGREAERDPGRLVVVSLKDEAGADQVQALRASIAGRETVSPHGTELYVVYPDGMGRSRLSLGAIERKLETRGTARNWNTVRKLHEMTVR